MTVHEKNWIYGLTTFQKDTGWYLCILSWGMKYWWILDESVLLGAGGWCWCRYMPGYSESCPCQSKWTCFSLCVIYACCLRVCLFPSLKLCWFIPARVTLIHLPSSDSPAHRGFVLGRPFLFWRSLSVVIDCFWSFKSLSSWSINANEFSFFVRLHWLLREIV